MSRRAAMWMTVMAALLLVQGGYSAVDAFEGIGADRQPLSFGTDQRIIDLSKVHWAPLRGERIKPGAQVTVLRGSLASGPVELLIRLPANYTLPMHSHSSDETYVWIKGKFTYIAEDGTAVGLPGRTFMSLPPNTPHGLTCGSEPCLLYVRYSQTFDLKTFPMPKLKQAALSNGD